MHPLFAKADRLSAEVIGAPFRVHRMMGSTLESNETTSMLLGLLFNFDEVRLVDGISRLILPGANNLEQKETKGTKSRLYRQRKASISTSRLDFRAARCAAQSWQHGMEKLRGDRLVGHFFAASRETAGNRRPDRRAVPGQPDELSDPMTRTDHESWIASKGRDSVAPVGEHGKPPCSCRLSHERPEQGRRNSCRWGLKPVEEARRARIAEPTRSLRSTGPVSTVNRARFKLGVSCDEADYPFFSVRFYQRSACPSRTRPPLRPCDQRSRWRGRD